MFVYCNSVSVSAFTCFYSVLHICMIYSQIFSLTYSRTDWLYSQKYDRLNSSLQRSIAQSISRSTVSVGDESIAWKRRYHSYWCLIAILPGPFNSVLFFFNNLIFILAFGLFFSFCCAIMWCCVFFLSSFFGFPLCLVYLLSDI